MASEKEERLANNGTVTVQDKLALRQRFGELEQELNDFLAAEYGVKKVDADKWKQSHKPFHWFSDFQGLLRSQIDHRKQSLWRRHHGGGGRDL